MDPFLPVSLVITLIGLALIDSTSFGTLVIPLIMVAQPRVRPARVALYLITLGVFYLGLGVLVLSGATWVREVLTGAENALQSTAAYVIQAVLGVGLIALSFYFDAPRVAKRRAARGGNPSRRDRWQKAAVGEHATRAAVCSCGCRNTARESPRGSSVSSGCSWFSTLYECSSNVA